MNVRCSAVSGCPDDRCLHAQSHEPMAGCHEPDGPACAIHPHLAAHCVAEPERKRLLCPLQRAEGQGRDCDEARCAWWTYLRDPKAGQCAITWIAKAG